MIYSDHTILGISIVVIAIACAYWRWFFYKPVSYTYPLVHAYTHQGFIAYRFSSVFFYGVRAAVCALLAFLAFKPYQRDVKILNPIKGIDIMMVVDVSGSMQAFDDLQDRRTRFEVAKQEAIRFIKKRDHDQIGLVYFAQEALARCPLTFDKALLIDIIKQTELGFIDANGTLLALGLAVASNRLKNSKASSRIIILLTDGQPSPGDIQLEQALAIAQEYGIKIYTIAIGSEQGGYYAHPFYGVQQLDNSINKSLLQEIAQATGGQFFEAKKPKDLATIYNAIDALEKSSITTKQYNHYYGMYIPFLLIALVLLLGELLVATFRWVHL